MNKELELIEKLKLLSKQKKSTTYYAKRLGISELDVKKLLNKIKYDSRSVYLGNTINPSSPIKEGIDQWEESKNDATLSASFKEEIKNLDDLVSKCKIDTNIWEITKYVQNYWGNSSTPHYQVKAWLGKKEVKEVDVLEKILANYKSKYIPFTQKELLINKVTNPVSVLISLADPHIDKRTLDKTTIDDKIKSYLQVLENLAFRAANAHEVGEIVYVLGNDYFTSDNYTPSTTKGTPQSVTNEYDESYEKGFELAVNSINLLKQLCKKLKVVFVPANHDRTKSFYLLHALQVYFSTDKNIEFDRSAENTKVHIFGNTLLGFHHGDTNMEKLPLYFCAKYRKEWGTTKYTEIAIADKHHKKQWSFKLTENEVNGIRQFISPSMTSPDVWHKDSCYDLAILAGTARIYDYDKGYCGELEERV